jgi:hypothetical protein
MNKCRYRVTIPRHRIEPIATWNCEIVGDFSCCPVKVENLEIVKVVVCNRKLIPSGENFMQPTWLNPWVPQVGVTMVPTPALVRGNA